MNGGAEVSPVEDYSNLPGLFRAIKRVASEYHDAAAKDYRQMVRERGRDHELCETHVYHALAELKVFTDGLRYEDDQVTRAKEEIARHGKAKKK